MKKVIWFGKKSLKRTIQKMSDVKKGKSPSQETREKLRLTSTGTRNPWFGKPTPVK